MHTDIRQLESGDRVEGDICIIGAGAAGLSIALEFRQPSAKVILLEGGGFDYDDQVQQLYDGKTTGQAYYPLKSTRLHYFGGTTGHWGGQCTPLDPIDFERKEWVPLSGWPFERQEIDPYYVRARHVLDLASTSYELGDWCGNNEARQPLAPKSSVIWSKLWQFVPPMRLNFGKKFKTAIQRSQNIHLYTYANATRLMMDPSGTRIEGVYATNHAGKSRVIKAKAYVLACCAIQNARLLLSSNDVIPAGIGNDNDLVGRHFMEHVEIRSGELWLARANPLKLYEYVWGETKARAELAITGEVQRKHRILNGTVALSPLALARCAKPMIALWNDADPRRSMDRLIKDETDSQAALSRVKQGSAAYADQAYELRTRLEQSPNPNSRVTLDEERDALGMPRANLNWVLTELEKHSLRTIQRLIGIETGFFGLGRVKLDAYLENSTDPAWPETTGGGWHHMGTTRMATDPKYGVVDAQCRVHGVANLYVAGSSCFPTSGAANPTLSLVALSLRLADHLKTAIA